MTALRAEFEKWAKEYGFQDDELARPRLRLAGDDYYNINTESAWQAYQAGHSAAPKPEEAP